MQYFLFLIRNKLYDIHSHETKVKMNHTAEIPTSASSPIIVQFRIKPVLHEQLYVPGKLLHNCWQSCFPVRHSSMF